MANGGTFFLTKGNLHNQLPVVSQSHHRLKNKYPLSNSFGKTPTIAKNPWQEHMAECLSLSCLAATGHLTFKETMIKNPISRYVFRQTDILHVFILKYSVGESAHACNSDHVEVRGPLTVVVFFSTMKPLLLELRLLVFVPLASEPSHWPSWLCFIEVVGPMNYRF